MGIYVFIIVLQFTCLCQVGLGETDHDYWGRPEDMTMGRPASLLDEAHGGSEVAAETAAAMAAASIAFRPTGRRSPLPQSGRFIRILPPTRHYCF